MPVLAHTDQCTGCTACASACSKNCITMMTDLDGFFHPQVDAEFCIDCGYCASVCPVLHPTAPERMPTAYAAYSRDEAMRVQSSSGGIFSEIARYILCEGGAVYGAAYDEEFRVVHVCVEEELQLGRLRGAKYAQSDLRGVFCEIKSRLDRGQKVFFSGTPCQVAGLRAYLRGNPVGLTCVDFVCHGVPSPMVWQRYVERISQRGRLRSINLRSKVTGWSHYRYGTRMEYENGDVRQLEPGSDLYMRLFVGDHINCTACADCRFKGYARQSDLTLGDFWEIWDSIPEMDDNKGTSVVLVHTTQGAELWRKLCDQLVTREVSLEAASEKNGAMLRSSVPHPKRTEILASIRSGNLDSCEELFAPPPVKHQIKDVFRCILQKLRRE